MDWADDVAYSVHDVEDGVHSGMIKLGQIGADARAQLCEVAASLYSDRPAAELSAVLDALLELPTLRDLGDYDGTSRRAGRGQTGDQRAGRPAVRSARSPRRGRHTATARSAATTPRSSCRPR